MADVAKAIEELDLYGYTVIEDAMPAEAADRMAEGIFGLHAQGGGHGAMLEGAGGRYETLFGLMNLSEPSWSCAADPTVLTVARHFLGAQMRLAEACSKVVEPGASAGAVHVDSAADLPEVLPQATWLINTMWMLTDFTPDNGATLMVPCSHHSRRRPPRELDWQDRRLVPVTGTRGSVALFRGGVWHASGANRTTDQRRLGLNIAYYPVWWNLAREGGHQPILPEVFARMPKELQDLNRDRVGAERSLVYEAS